MERVCSGIANELCELGYDITIISLFKGLTPYFETNSKIKLIGLYENKLSFKTKYIQIVWALKKLMQEHQYDILICVDSLLMMYALPASLLAGNKTRQFAWEHFNCTVHFNLKIRFYARWLSAKFADKVILLTHRDIELWQQHFGKTNNLVCIPNPAMLENIAVTNYNLREKIILTVGRLTYQKGLDLLIEAWAKIETQLADWELIIVGSGEDEAFLKELASKRLNMNNLLFVPSTKDVERYYNAASLFCLSSRFEGLPMVLIEAQTFALPIVSFECDTGPSEIIVSGKNGLLCEALNIDQLAESILLCAQNKSMLEQFSSEALLSVKRFSKVNIINLWIKEIENQNTSHES